MHLRQMNSKWENSIKILINSCVAVVLTICSFDVDVDSRLDLHSTVIHFCTDLGTTYTVEHYLAMNPCSKIVYHIGKLHMRTGENYKINFYTQIDSYIELATHFRLERLKFVSLQESNQSLSINRNCKKCD